MENKYTASDFSAESTQGGSLARRLLKAGSAIGVGVFVFNQVFHGGFFAAPSAPAPQLAQRPAAEKAAHETTPTQIPAAQTKVTTIIEASPADKADDPYFAGLPEIQIEHNPGSRISKRRDTYLRDSSELREALRLCHENPAQCHPKVRDFAMLLDQVALIKSKIVQVSVVNAWVNLAIAYDKEEAAKMKGNEGHRSLLQSVEEQAGVCDEQARLKLFVLEQLGFPNKDLRWVREDVYANNKISDAHAITIVRLGNTNWILDNDVIVWNGGGDKKTQQRVTLNSAEVVDSIQVGSTLYANWSVPLSNKERNIPVFSFNAEKQFAYYLELNDDYRKIRVPKSATPYFSMKKNQTYDLTKANLAALSPQVLRLLETAMGEKYQVAGAFNKLAQRQNLPDQEPANIVVSNNPVRPTGSAVTELVSIQKLTR